MSRAKRVPNHLPQAIVATILFPIFGVVAIFYASRVHPRLSAGDFARAAELSDRARVWTRMTLASAAVVWGTVLALIFL
jgi:hypothetical protein